MAANNINSYLHILLHITIRDLRGLIYCFRHIFYHRYKLNVPVFLLVMFGPLAGVDITFTVGSVRGTCMLSKMLLFIVYTIFLLILWHFNKHLIRNYQFVSNILTRK